MRVRRGIAEALLLASCLAMVAGVAAQVWVSLGDGTYVARLGTCLFVLGAVVFATSGGVLGRLVHPEDAPWRARWEPGTARSPDDAVLTGEGRALLVGLPLAVVGVAVYALG